MDPILSSDPRYACVNTNCGFSLHVVCNDLPPLLHLESHHQHPLHLKKRSCATSFFECDICERTGNSLIYRCESCHIHICIRCAIASSATSILHNAHPDHILTQTKADSNLIVCNACGYLPPASAPFAFGCKDCKFYLHYECALLPPTTRRRWHDHPHALKYPPYPDHPDEFYCWVCEDLINPNRWMYDCAECDYSLHTWCNPPLGKFRILKFGVEFTAAEDDHSHPLVLVREAKYKASCEACGTDLEWGVAFECDACHYYLCPDCARKKELSRLESQNG